MRMEYGQQSQSEIGGIDLGPQGHDDFGPEANRGLRQAESLVAERSHECDGCGETTSDVDLWAENSETGEEIWLCVTCGGW